MPRMDDSRAFVFDFEAAVTSRIEHGGHVNVVVVRRKIDRPFVFRIEAGVGVGVRGCICVRSRVDVARMEFSEKPFSRYVFDGSGQFAVQVDVLSQEESRRRKNEKCGREPINSFFHRLGCTFSVVVRPLYDRCSQKKA